MKSTCSSGGRIEVRYPSDPGSTLALGDFYIWLSLLPSLAFGPPTRPIYRWQQYASLVLRTFLYKIEQDRFTTQGITQLKKQLTV